MLGFAPLGPLTFGEAQTRSQGGRRAVAKEGGGAATPPVLSPNFQR